MKRLMLIILLTLKFNLLFSQSESIMYSNDHLWEKPDVSSKILMSIPYGSKVHIVNKNYNSEWAKIKYKGNTGYTRKISLEREKSQTNKPFIIVTQQELNNLREESNKTQINHTEQTTNSFRSENINDSKKSEKKHEEEILLPPILKIEDITFSTNVLYAEKNATLSISLKNLGLGDARDVTINLSGGIKGLSFPKSTKVPTIKNNGSIETVKIDFKGELDLITSVAEIKIEINEPNFKVNIQGKQLKFPTREFIKPELIIAQYSITEHQSAEPNNQIDINEVIDIKFAIQNIGQGKADSVTLNIENNQKGVMFLGAVRDNQITRKSQFFSTIESGKYEIVTYRYFVNSEFLDNELKFSLTTNERIGKFGFSETKSFEINKEIQETGYIRKVATVEEIVQGNVIIQDIPDFVVDVDVDIPISQIKQNNTYALIIGNEDYKSKQKSLSTEQNVDYAINDATVFALYCEKTLGIPKKQIKILKNATSAEINQGIAWLSNLSKIEMGNAKIIFYYSGHGLPHEETKESYIIPVDVSGHNITYGIKIDDVYKALTEYPAKQITVFLDACFSGGARNQSLVSAKAIRVRPKENIINGNLIVFSSSTGEESSSIYEEKQHGYFTYFLLKKLKETQGDINFKELGEYIIQSVSKETGLKGIIQTPQVNISNKIIDEWESRTLK